MSGKEDNRIFVGGLGWDVTERQLEHAFDRYGKILECQTIHPPRGPVRRASELKIFKSGALG